MSFFRSRPKRAQTAPTASEQLKRPLPFLPFEVLNPEAKNLYLVTLNHDKKTLAQKSLRDLYEVTTFLEKNMVSEKSQPSVNLTLAQRKNLLKHVTAEFNQRIANSPELPVIKANAHHYLQATHTTVQRSNPGLLSGFVDKAKRKVDKVLFAGKNTTDYFKLYEYHLKQVAATSQKKHESEILIKDFSELSKQKDQQQLFINTLLSQSESTKDKVLSAQTFLELKALQTLCKDSYNPARKQLAVEIGERIQNLPAKFNEGRPYGDVALIKDYLTSNNQIIQKAVQAKSPGTKNEVIEIAAILPAEEGKYNVSIQYLIAQKIPGSTSATRTMRESTTHEISREDALQYASIPLAKKNKEALKVELGITPAPVEQVTQSTQHTKTRSKTI